MISPVFSNFITEALLFNTELNININVFFIDNYNYLLPLLDYTDYSSLKFYSTTSIFFMNFVTETSLFNTELNINIVTFSIPNYDYLLFLSDYSNYSNLKFFNHNE